MSKPIRDLPVPEVCPEKGDEVRIDRERLHSFVEQKCEEIEKRGGLG